MNKKVSNEGWRSESDLVSPATISDTGSELITESLEIAGDRGVIGKEVCEFAYESSEHLSAQTC